MNTNENKKIWDYFEDSVDYPTVMEDILPWNIAWHYVSSTFLNGLINYVKPIGCWMIDRYTARDWDARKIEFQFGHDVKWKGTKQELIDKVISEEVGFFHTDLDVFNDDIVILAQIGENKYTFFYFDCDVSDCSIGRFETTDTKEEIMQSVKNWLEKCKKDNNGFRITENTDNGIIDYTELPLSFINGWVKFK